MLTQLGCARVHLWLEFAEPCREAAQFAHLSVALDFANDVECFGLGVLECLIEAVVN
jgi:hypothetical protein